MIGNSTLQRRKIIGSSDRKAGSKDSLEPEIILETMNCLVCKPNGETTACV